MTLSIIILAFIINIFISKTLQNRRIKKYWFLSFYIVLGAIIGLRSLNDGVDTSFYYSTYNLFNNFGLKTVSYMSHMEFGYLLLNKISQFIGLEYHGFQFVFSVIMMLLYGNFIYDNTKDIYLATLVFLGAGYFAFSFNIIRQMMAIAVCANSWKYIKEKKYIVVIILIFIAASIHKTALLFVIPFLLYKYRYNIIIRYGYSILLILLPSLLPFIFSIAQSINLYDNYTVPNNNEGVKVGYIYILWSIEYIMFAYILFSRKFSSTDKVIANLSLSSVTLSIMAQIVIYMDRVGLLFFPFVLLSFCIFGDKISKSNLKILYFSITSILLFLFFIYRSSDISQFVLYF